jgi:hypothetical protein
MSGTGLNHSGRGQEADVRSPSSGSDSSVALERGRERELRGVPDRDRDRRESLIAVAQTLGGESHAPVGEVRHGSNPKGLPKAPREDRAGEAGLAGQARDGPWMGRITVNGVQRGGDSSVVERLKPEGRHGGLRPEVVTQNVHERDVEQAIKERLLTGLVAEHLACEQIHRCAERAARGRRHPNDVGQSRQKTVAEVALEGVRTANEHGGARICGIAKDEPARRARDGPRGNHRGKRRAARLEIVGHSMLDRAAHEDDVSGKQRERVCVNAQPDLPVDDSMNRQTRVGREPETPRAVGGGVSEGGPPSPGAL